MNRSHIQMQIVGAALAALALGGCRDEFVAPTQGFIAVRNAGAFDVEVSLDGESAGVDPGVLGPLDAGSYTVASVRECFRVEPANRLVSVVAAETTYVDFSLTLAEFGTVVVTAKDELTGAAIDGAGVFQETAPGVYTSTGLVTPASVDQVPCGTARFRAAKSGFEQSPIVEVLVNTGVESQVAVELGPARGALLEMFTYSVCPNCPAAADTIHAVQTDFPGRTFAIEWHSGQTGPLFPLYDARWKERERYYSDGATVGYPGTSIGGRVPLLQSGTTSDLSQYRPVTAEILAECVNDCPLALRLEGTIGTTSADLTARVKWRGGSIPGNLKLRFVFTEDHVKAPGNELPEGFDAVARAITEQDLVLGAPGQVLAIPAFLPILAWPYPGDVRRVLAFIQSDATKEILAVSGIE